MKENDAEINKMPEKDVLEDYLTSQRVNEPVGVVFNPETGFFKRIMPREEWLIERESMKRQRESYAERVRQQFQGEIIDD